MRSAIIPSMTSVDVATVLSNCRASSSAFGNAPLLRLSTHSPHCAFDRYSVFPSRSASARVSDHAALVSRDGAAANIRDHPSAALSCIRARS